MDRIRVPLQLCANNIRRWANNPRFYILAVLAFLWIHYLVNPIKEFSAGVGVNVTIWGFPFLLTQWYPHMVFLLGGVLLFCDAPFASNGTPYECVRSGKLAWTGGQQIYIGVAAFIYVLFLFISSVICIIPNITLSGEWGKVYSTLAQTRAGAYGIISISYHLLLSYTPLQATALSCLLLVLEVCMAGMLMFLINSVTSRAIGVFCGLVLSFLPSFASVASGTQIYYFLPTTWANLLVLDASGRSPYPSVGYAVALLLLINGILILASLLIARKKQIEILMPV